MLYTHPSSWIFEPSECIPFSEINKCESMLPLSWSCSECMSLVLSSFLWLPVPQTIFSSKALLPQSQSLTLSIHRHILIRLLSQTTPLALNIPVQRQRKHACKRFHDFRLWQEARGQCAYVSRHSFSIETCSGRQGAPWLTQDWRQLGDTREGRTESLSGCRALTNPKLIGFSQKGT